MDYRRKRANQNPLTMKQKKKQHKKISINDYIKAVKKADREIQLENSVGWTSTTKVHKSKKVYDRRRDKNHKREEY